MVQAGEGVGARVEVVAVEVRVGVGEAVGLLVGEVVAVVVGLPDADEDVCVDAAAQDHQKHAPAYNRSFG